MTLNGNHYRAEEDNFGNVIVFRKRDASTVYLQGEDATEFLLKYQILEVFQYPIGPFQTLAEHVDACLDVYDAVMESH